MKKKLLLMMSMVLMGAMASWAGQVIIDPLSYDHGYVQVSNMTPAPDEIVTIYVLPDSGYCLFMDSIVVQPVDGSLVPQGPPLNVTGQPDPELVWDMFQGEYMFTMPNDPSLDVLVTVMFTKRPYGVGGNWTPGGGTSEIALVNGVRPFDTWGVQAYMGDTITLGVVSYDFGFHNVSYLVTANVAGHQETIPVDPNTGEFIMPPGDVHVEPTFWTQQYKVIIDPAITDGSVVPNQPFADPGEEIILDIFPNTGFVLDDLYGTDYPPDTIQLQMIFRDSRYWFTMPASDVEVKANFFPIGGGPYQVNINPTSHGRITTNPTIGDAGDIIIVDVSDADPYYVIDSVFVDLFSGLPVPVFPSPYGDHTEYWFILPAHDVNVKATFRPIGHEVKIDTTITNGTVIANPPFAEQGQRVILLVEPDPGYQFDPSSGIGSISATKISGGVPITLNQTNTYEFEFWMPDDSVFVTATFVPIDYTLYVEIGNLYGTITTVNINSAPVTLQPHNADYDKYTPVHITDNIDVISTAIPGYVLKEYILTSGVEDNPFTIVIPNPSTSYSTTDTLNIPVQLGDMRLNAVYDLYEFKVITQTVSNGSVDAWKGADIITASGPFPNYGDIIDLTDNPKPGWELDHYELYKKSDGTGPYNNYWTWTSPPTNTQFFMPDFDVIVKPVFRKKTFYIVYDNRPNPGASLSIRNVTQGTTNTVLPAVMGDTIEMTATETPPLNNFPFDYFTFDEYDMNNQQVITNLGEMSGHTFVSPLSYVTTFTMPPLDLLIGAYFWDPNGPTMPPPPNPIEMWTDTRGNPIYRGGGMVLLHRVYQTKSSTFWDEPQNYGWSDAKPGQPMYFTVMPDLGFHVRKSEITVQLVDASLGEGNEKSRVIKEFKGGPEIFGPDEYVTEPTDYYFIFDVPEDMDPNKVQVKIFANFNPVDYTITVDDAIEHGTITAPAGANADEIVTLTVNPEPGYRLESITVTPEEPGFFVTVDSNNQFVMPACNVTVTATFKEAEFELGDVNGDNRIDIDDVTIIISAVLGIGTVDHLVADVNNDTRVDIDDVTLLIGRVLNGHW